MLQSNERDGDSRIMTNVAHHQGYFYKAAHSQSVTVSVATLKAITLPL